jgi:uncharacterized integral membrane protein (TIGR00697 family)
MLTNQKQKTWPHYLWLLMLVYAQALVVANWFDARLIAFGPFVTDAGTIIFPLTFIVGDIITEVYGYQYARRAIWIGFFTNLIVLLYGQLIIHLPSPTHAPFNHLFSTLLGQNLRICIASSISYLCAEPANAYLIAKLKIINKGRMMWLRFLLSTMIGASIDTSIFSFIAFYHVIPVNEILAMIGTVWLVKIIIEIIGLPFSTILSKKLKVIEGIDQYDYHTKFSLLRWRVTYSSKVK